MAIFESFRVALEAIWANKLRALLTMLGVIIGVSSVIIMISIVQGLRQSIVEQISGNGAGVIFTAYAPRHDKQHGPVGISAGDLASISDRCDLVQDISPSTSVGVTAHVGSNSKTVQLMGVEPGYGDSHNMVLTSGRFLTDDDNANFGKGCVIGEKLKAIIYGDSDPLGRELLCSFNGSTVALEVVGVLAEKDTGGEGVDFNNGIFASLRSVQLRFTGDTTITDFTARSKDVTQTEAAADQIWGVIKDRHPTNYKDYIVDTEEGLLKQIDTIIGTIQLALGGVAGLSLITGGIGIMNIMLVSVTERTREIGIRKAVGATRGAILTQFVVEAIVVSGVGGIIGLLIGDGVAALIDHFAHKDLPTFVPLWAELLGFGFSVGIGLFFGSYPAFKASKLDPIQALRHE